MNEHPLLPTLESPPAKEAVRVENVGIDYATLAALARGHAHRLLARGVKAGDQVIVPATAAIETIVAIVGNALGGFVTVPVNPLGAAADEAGPAPSDVSLPAVSADAACVILHTSGTTGAPKGALHTHGALARNLDAVFRAWQWTARDVVVHALPLFHGHGFVLGLLGPLRVGGTVLISPRFDAGELAATMAREATMLFGSPDMLQQLGELCERDEAAASALRKARMLVTGSAPFPVRESDRIRRLTGHRVIERYGITETLFNASTRPGDDRPGHVDRPLDGVEIRLVDDRRQPLVASDAIGELAIRNPGLCREYVGRPEATAASRDAEGWFYTGDLGTIAADGAIRLLGHRATDLLIVRGERVAAQEIETVLLEHPAVREVAVVGTPSDGDGDAIVAFVELYRGACATSDVLCAHAATRLPRARVPREIRLVDKLPRNAIGKVVKTELEALAAMPSREWDAAAYDHISEPQFQWGLRVLERLELAGDEIVIDAGCGSGRLTELLLERLPRGHVIAIDASQNMIDQAHARLVPRFGDRVELRRADLLDVELVSSADVVFSTATFHWIKDHDRLFATLARALKPGGRLIAQCGGGPILAHFHERAHAVMRSPSFAPYYEGFTENWYYAGDVDTAHRLQSAGFRNIRTSLEQAPTRFRSAAEWMTFLRKVVVRGHLARLPTLALQDEFLNALAERASHDDPPFTLDYWRLNLEARAAD